MSETNENEMETSIYSFETEKLFYKFLETGDPEHERAFFESLDEDIERRLANKEN